MNPSPFLARYLIDWLTTQTMNHARQAVVDEVKSRVESGNLGDYDGILFKDSFQSQGKSASGQISVGGVDLGVVAATKRELVGLLDKMGTPKTTKGGSFKYYTGVWQGVKVAIIETGEGVERARQGVEALLQAFRPARVVSLGFATALAPTLKSGALFTPERLVLENGATRDLTASKLQSAQKSETSESETSSESEQKPTEEPQTQESQVPPTSSFASEFLSRFSSGALLGVDREIVKKSEKKSLFESTGASACDRSSWAIADVCGSRGVPLLILRVLYEPNASVQGVSREAAQFARNSNQSMARSLGAFFGAVTKKPSAALDVLKLKEEALAAADKLANALETILKTSKPKAQKAK